MITGLGLAVFGADFARLDPPERLDAVKRLLARVPGAAGVGQLRDGPGDARPGRARPRRWTRRAARSCGSSWTWVRDHSRSTVIITSRAQEDWLGQVRRIPVGGLNRAEAAQYAELPARPVPGRAGAAGAPVVRGTAGLAGRPPPGDAAHPAPPGCHRPGRPAGRAAGHHPAARREDAGPGRLSSLGACITYSFAHLSGQTRRLLPAVSLFHGVADANLLTAFSAAEGVPGRFAGVSKQEWTAVLEDAARVGLLTGLGARHVPDPPGPARLPRRRMAGRRPRRLRPGTGGMRAGTVHRLRRTSAGG